MYIFKKKCKLTSQPIVAWYATRSGARLKTENGIQGADKTMSQKKTRKTSNKQRTLPRNSAKKPTLTPEHPPKTSYLTHYTLMMICCLLQLSCLSSFASAYYLWISYQLPYFPSLVLLLYFVPFLPLIFAFFPIF